MHRRLVRFHIEREDRGDRGRRDAGLRQNPADEIRHLFGIGAALAADTDRDALSQR